MNTSNPKRILRNRIADVAEECAIDPARYSQCVATVLFSLSAALSADAEEQLMNHVAKFAQGEVRRLTASRN